MELESLLNNSVFELDSKIEQYLDVLNEQQKEAVVHNGKSLLILAGAGSGKTRVVTTKIAYMINRLNVNPESILSVTFTKKAANEMRQRAVQMENRAESCQIRTFHSFGSWFLRRYANAANVSSSFTVYDDEDMAALVKKAVPSLSTKEAHRAAHEISLCKDYCLFPEDDLSSIESDFDLNNIYKLYENRLRATGNTDFGDLIMLPVKIMQENANIANYIRNRFKVIMVDEYQDSNIAQYKLLQTLSGIETENPNYVCVVGDDDQSIYKFRGAEVQNILSFPDKFPGTDIIRLERNYRSTGKILKAASLVVQNNSNRLGKELVADRGEGGNPAMIFLGDQNEEAVFCTDLIKKSVLAGGKYSDFALLYRTNAQSLNFEKAFLHKKIPYVIVGSLKFYEREEIKDALAYLSLCANHKDELAFRRVVNKPPRGIGEKTQDKILEKAIKYSLNDQGENVISYEDLIETMKLCSGELSKKALEGGEKFITIFDSLNNFYDENKSLSEFVQKLITDSKLDEFHKASDEIEGTQRVLNLQELVNSAVPYECTKEGLLAFLDAIDLDRNLEIKSEEDLTDAVTLITLHNTKGLEYNKVIITGLEEGVFPRQDKTGAELEEERRLFYVGITRARDELYITSCQKRCLYGAWQFMKPSPFLQEASEAFKILGKVPFGFNKKHEKKSEPLNWGKQGIPGQENSIKKKALYEKVSFGDKDFLAKKWKKGMKIYHDDYGEGYIVDRKLNEGEFIITVQFQLEKKKFLPEYQGKSLNIVKDE